MDLQLVARSEGDPIAENVNPATESAFARPLREEILDLIWPWRDSREKPPFSAEDLVVIALSYSEVPMTLTALHTWLLDTFRYYGSLAIREYAECLMFNPGDDDDDEFWMQNHQVTHVIDGLANATRSIDVPLHINPESKAYSIDVAAARLCLREKIEPARKGVFDLMGLPKELRDKIYKMSLKFPRPGIRFSNWDDPKIYYTKQVHPGKPQKGMLMSREDCDYHNYGNRLSRSSYLPRNTLALFQVSKQVLQEAREIFYDTNTLYFGDLMSFSLVLDRMSPATQKAIRHLHVYMGKSGHQRDLFDGLTELPAQLSGLCPQKLELVLSTSYHGTTDRGGIFERLEFQAMVKLAREVKDLEYTGDGEVLSWMLNNCTKEADLRVHSLRSLTEVMRGVSVASKKRVKSLHLVVCSFQARDVDDEILADLSPERLVLRFAQSYTYDPHNRDIATEETQESFVSPGMRSFVKMARRVEKVECTGRGLLKEWFLSEMARTEGSGAETLE